MRPITYLQGAVVLADVGSGAQALALPQDELTALVRIAAILARNFGSRLPGEYRAVLRDADGSHRVITEDDPRIAQARDLLRAIAQDRDYTAPELEQVRQALSNAA
ncbi:hypothetical protein KGA66_10045 [Actinocrinis puniceicyclus]|uniref:Uncharacterized protein n=1 Tax=Actinocrinis puniceicyclus TaxID=977794 RepID=A0A8J7WNJ0_9ACTN|nr:hypothetical protein [Actinocrinis puniceicyclus]MBS2963387.1 hypothetical protein [Actinocrinis puniceicyclus]